MVSWAYIPEGSRVLVLAQNENWLYVADETYDKTGYVRIVRDESSVLYLEGDGQVILEDALVYE